MMLNGSWAVMISSLLEIQAQCELDLPVGSSANRPGNSLVELPEAPSSARRFHRKEHTRLRRGA